MKFSFGDKIYITRDWLNNREYDLLVKTAACKDNLEEVTKLTRAVVKSIIIDPKIEDMDEVPSQLTFEIIQEVSKLAQKITAAIQISTEAGQEKFKDKEKKLSA